MTGPDVVQPADAFLVGGMKAGTSYLAAALETSPDVAVSRPKEPHWFSLGMDGFRANGPQDRRLQRLVCRDAARYTRAFAHADPGQLRLDASATYLTNPRTPARLAAACPSARILVVLRNPIDRAHSAYLHLLRDGLVEGSFEEALAAEPARRAAGWGPLWSLVEAGRYASSVERYLETFGPASVHVTLAEELRDAPTSEVARICGFLGVRPPALEAVATTNRSGVPRVGWLFRTLSATSPGRLKLKRLVPPRVQRWVIRRRDGLLVADSGMSGATRERLRERFADDVAQLARLLPEHDLDRWKDFT